MTGSYVDGPLSYGEVLGRWWMVGPMGSESCEMATRQPQERCNDGGNTSPAVAVQRAVRAMMDKEVDDYEVGESMMVFEEQKLLVSRLMYMTLTKHVVATTALFTTAIYLGGRPIESSDNCCYASVGDPRNDLSSRVN